MRLRLRPWRRPALQSATDVPDPIVGELLRTALERDGMAMWRARGTSMRGTIADGALVKLVRPSGTRVRPGAVALGLVGDGRLVLHRVTHCSADRVMLQGDALRRPDGFTHITRIIAVADPTPRPGRLVPLYRLFG